MSPANLSNHTSAKQRKNTRVLFPADPQQDLAAILGGTPSLSRFSALLSEHGLSPTMDADSGDMISGNSFTVFAPTNDALDRLEEQRPWLFSSAGLFNDGENFGGGGRGKKGDEGWSPVRELLAYHLVPGDALFSRCVAAFMLCIGLCLLFCHKQQG